MKTFRMIGKGLFAVLLCCAFVSCSSDDSEDDPTPPAPPTPPAELPEYAVDLGLPSGTIWADRNVGADSPEGYGYYFAWGETTSKSTFNWNTYKWCRGSSTTTTLTKYCNKDSYGVVDDKITLDAEDDAATVNMGEEWRMPTNNEFTELQNKCSWKWTTQNNVNGYKVTGPNGNSIFLPAAGSRQESTLQSVGSYGAYWSSSLVDSGYPIFAYFVGFTSDDSKKYDSNGRCYGHTVRAVVK